MLFGEKLIAWTDKDLIEVFYRTHFFCLLHFDFGIRLLSSDLDRDLLLGLIKIRKYILELILGKKKACCRVITFLY